MTAEQIAQLEARRIAAAERELRQFPGAYRSCYGAPVQLSTSAPKPRTSAPSQPYDPSEWCDASGVKRSVCVHCQANAA